MKANVILRLLPRYFFPDIKFCASPERFIVHGCQCHGTCHRRIRRPTGHYSLRAMSSQLRLRSAVLLPL